MAALLWGVDDKINISQMKKNQDIIDMMKAVREVLPNTIERAKVSRPSLVQAHNIYIEKKYVGMIAFGANDGKIFGTIGNKNEMTMLIPADRPNSAEDIINYIEKNFLK